MTTNKLHAADIARAWQGYRPIYLDTETTGLTVADEIVEIAILDHNGAELLCSLVKPVRLPIPEEVTRKIHGITNAMVRDAPAFRELAPQIWDLIYAAPLIITYNAEFDARMIRQSAYNNLLAVSGRRGNWRCAMKLYAQFRGDYDEIHNGFAWHALAAALQQCSITLPNGLHRAKADAEACRRIVDHIAHAEQG